jgi:hypothetical protein
MKGKLGIKRAALILLGMAVLSLQADNQIKNGDLKDGMSGWHGDGSLVYLKADGTEGSDTDTDAIPVIKMHLRGESQSVFQDYEAKDTPTTLHVKVDVYASSDFKRSTDSNDYNIQWKAGGTWYWSALVIPNVDFWIRGASSTNCYKLADLKPGAWTTVEGRFEGLPKDLDRSIDFCVPAGHGAVYIKNITVEP